LTGYIAPTEISATDTASTGIQAEVRSLLDLEIRQKGTLSMVIPSLVM
jgi:hypothetical protein